MRVRARNGCGAGGTSNEITLVVGSSSPGSIDGTWSGTTGQGRTFEMTVSGGRITTIRYGYSVSGCSSTVTTNFNTPLAVTNGAFTTSMPGAGASTTISGTFVSNSFATGTLQVILTPIPFVQPCSGTLNSTWTASK